VTPPRGGRPLARADLPAEFTPESVRRLGMRTIRQLADPDNGVLTPDEQHDFDAAWREVIADAQARARDAMDRAARGGRDQTDPELRRSYARAQQRLREQARRGRLAFPELDLPDEPAPPAPEPGEPPAASTDDVSVASLTDDLEETSTTLELLDRIASIQQQQLEHQESQLLLDTRGTFFALLVSVAVIIAGVAPLVEADGRDRWLIALWTLAVCVLAGGVYGAVRAVQRRS